MCASLKNRLTVYYVLSPFWYFISGLFFLFLISLMIGTSKGIEVFSHEIIVKTWSGLVIYKGMLLGENALKCHNNYIKECNICPENVCHC